MSRANMQICSDEVLTRVDCKLDDVRNRDDDDDKDDHANAENTRLSRRDC